MIRLHRLGLWFALALVVVLVAAAELWLRGPQSDGAGSTSLVPTPSHVAEAVSPLATPAPSNTAAAPSWTGVGAVLLWVALGSALGLGIAFLVLRRHRHDMP